jgi:hypothetical protein
MNQHRVNQSAPGVLQYLSARWYWGLVPLLLLLVLVRIGCARRAANPDTPFDVPSLLGKDIDGVTATLGKEVWDDAFAQRKYGEMIDKPYAYKTWVHKNRALTAVYTHDWGQASDKTIKEFFLSTVDEPGASTEKKSFLDMGNVHENDPRYTLEFVEAPNQPGSYVGVKVRPSPNITPAP